MNLERELCAIEALIFSCILLGGLSIQYFMHETPCVLCFLQRLAMTGVATLMLLNARSIPRKKYYGFALLFALFGGFVALRQIALHVCPSFSTSGHPFWGLSLYTWSFLSFVCSVGYNGLLLILFSGQGTPAKAEPMSKLGHFTFFVLLGTTFANILSAIHVCGWLSCSR